MRIEFRYILLFCCAVLASSQYVATSRADEPLQLLRNGGFEEDEMTLRSEPASSCGGETNDQWYNMQDRFPDGWQWLKVYVPNNRGNAKVDRWPLEGVAIDTAIKRSGKSSVRLSGKEVTFFQTIEWNRLTDLYHEKAKRGPALSHTARLPQTPGLFQEMTLSGWAHNEGLPADAQVSATLVIPGRGTVSVNIPRGTVGWQPFTVILGANSQSQPKPEPALPAKKRTAKGKASSKGRATAKGKGLGELLEIYLELNGGAEGQGSVWFDDLSLTMAPRSEPNLLPNASFENVVPAKDAHQAHGPGTQAQGAIAPQPDIQYPAGWSLPRKWHYLPPPVYYIWNNWQHFYSPTRGVPVSDGLVTHSGRRSLRFDLYPGDEYLIESQPIKLNQQELRPIEVTAWVRADRLRHFDLILVDQDGNRLPTNDILPFWGGLLAGTHDWIAVRKIFLGHGPLQNVRLRLAGRGFNGQTETDIGIHHAYKQVSTVWIDDVAVREIGSTAPDLTSRGVSLPAAEKPDGCLRVVNLDLGERLVGDNVVTAEVRNDTSETVRASLATVRYFSQSPARREPETKRSPEVELRTGETAKITVSYGRIPQNPSWRSIPLLGVELRQNGKDVAREGYRFSGWPVIANVRPSKAYLDETENPMLASINLGVTQPTLSQIEKLNVQVINRSTGEAVASQEVRNLAEKIASTKIPGAADEKFYYQVPRAGLLDFRNLLLVPLDISRLPLRPWDNPEADWIIRVTGVAKDGSQFFTSDSHPFGRLTRINEMLPPVKEVTVDPQGHFLRVNGKPFFIFAQSHGNGISLGGAPATRRVPPWTRNEHAMNSSGRWSGINDIEGLYDKQQFYGPMLMATTPKAGSLESMLADLGSGNVSIYTTGHHNKSKLLTLEQLNNQPSALGLFVMMSEGIVADSPDLRAVAQFGSALSKKVKRPVGAMDNHSQFYPWNAEPGGLLDGIDLLFMEREEGNLFRPELSVRDWMKRNPHWMICDLPQTYENVPHERERYQALKNTLHGARGWFGIQGCADPSLYRGLGGELRYIFTYLSANEGMPTVTAPAGIVAKAWKKGDKVLVMAEQHNPVPRGRWEWKTGIGGLETKSHSGESRHLVTPVKAGYAIHGYNDDIYREVSAGDSLEQTVYVDPAKKPKAVFLVIPGNNDFNHVAYWGDFDHEEFRSKKLDAFLAAECYSMASYGINWARSKDEGFLKYQAEHRFPARAFVRMGDLPEAGQWATVNVPLDKLGLTGKVVDGLMFMTSGNGRAWWGRSSLVHKNGERETLLDGRIGRDPDQFANAVVKVAGLVDANVRVIGESRTLSFQNGSLTDDLKGRDLYGFFGDGWLGDGINYGQPVDSVPEQLELSYTYDDSPRCIRIYEISPSKK